LNTDFRALKNAKYPPEGVRVYISHKNGTRCYGSYSSNYGQSLPKWTDEFGQHLDSQNISEWRIAQFTINFRYKGNCRKFIYSSSSLHADSEIQAKNIMLKIAKGQSLQSFKILEEGNQIDRVAS
jgi:hypothetical protein